MRIKKSVICIILIVAVCLSCVGVVAAVEPRASAYLTAYEGYVVATGNGDVEDYTYYTFFNSHYYAPNI